MIPTHIRCSGCGGRTLTDMLGIVKVDGVPDHERGKEQRFYVCPQCRVEIMAKCSLYPLPDFQAVTR